MNNQKSTIENSKSPVPGAKPIPIETVWGDPDAESKADAMLAAMPVCYDQEIHCPHCNADRTCKIPGLCPAEDVI
jgi:hypothetical protein